VAPEFASFLYIDAEHYEDTAEASVRAVEHCARPDCVWAFHDYGIPDVQRVAERLATRRGYASRFTIRRTVLPSSLRGPRPPLQADGTSQSSASSSCSGRQEAGVPNSITIQMFTGRSYSSIRMLWYLWSRLDSPRVQNL
jgi:hypothetical protein